MGENPASDPPKPTPAALAVFLSPGELADRWGGKVSPRTLEGWRARGYGPPVTRLGGRVFYELAAVVAWEKRDAARAPARPTDPT